MKFYKIRHKPTGLFFRPSRHMDKRNLSKIGKAYSRKPSLSFLGTIYAHPYTGPKPVRTWQMLEIDLQHYNGYEMKIVILDEWEIVEYESIQQ